jgi:ribonuclease P protein component
VQQALAAPVKARSPHFVLHCLAGRPLVPQLLTVGAPEPDRSVDNRPGRGRNGLGFVIPKRWARRAATRNLIRRQMREAVRRHQARFADGASLLLRQRSAFERERFTSAASSVLREAVRAELDALFGQLAPA